MMMMMMIVVIIIIIIIIIVYAACVTNSRHERRSLYELCSEIPVLSFPCEELRHCVVFNLGLIICW